MADKGLSGNIKDYYAKTMRQLNQAFTIHHIKNRQQWLERVVTERIAKTPLFVGFSMSFEGFENLQKVVKKFPRMISQRLDDELKHRFEIKLRKHVIDCIKATFDNQGPLPDDIRGKRIRDYDLFLQEQGVINQPMSGEGEKWAPLSDSYLKKKFAQQANKKAKRDHKPFKEYYTKPTKDRKGELKRRSKVAYNLGRKSALYQIMTAKEEPRTVAVKRSRMGSVVVETTRRKGHEIAGVSYGRTRGGRIRPDPRPAKILSAERILSGFKHRAKEGRVSPASAPKIQEQRLVVDKRKYKKAVKAKREGKQWKEMRYDKEMETGMRSAYMGVLTGQMLKALITRARGSKMVSGHARRATGESGGKSQWTKSWVHAIGVDATKVPQIIPFIFGSTTGDSIQPPRPITFYLYEWVTEIWRQDVVTAYEKAYQKWASGFGKKTVPIKKDMVLPKGISIRGDVLRTTKPGVHTTVRKKGLQVGINISAKKITAKLRR